MEAIRRALLVPLQIAPVLLIVIFSALLWLASHAGLFGFPLALILLSWFFKYAFVVLDELVAGRSEAPVLSVDMVNPASEQRPLIFLVLVLAVFFTARAGEHWFGPVLSALVAVAAAALLPAVLAMQAVTGTVRESLNPLRCIAFARRLGRDYLVLLAVAVFALGAASWFMSAELAAGLPTIVRISVPMYLWLAVFASVGVMVDARREDLGVEDAYEALADDEIATSQNQFHDARARERFLDRIYAEWRGGAHRNAWQSVEVELSASADAQEYLQWMYMRASQWPDQRLAERLAQRLLATLLRSERNGEALRVARERLRQNPGFRPEKSDELLALVRLARDGGERPTARALLVDVEKLFPEVASDAAVRQLRLQLER